MLRENNEVSEKLLRKLLSYSDKNRDGKVDVHEFTAMMLNKDFKLLFGDYVNRYLYQHIAFFTTNLRADHWPGSKKTYN